MYRMIQIWAVMCKSGCGRAADDKNPARRVRGRERRLAEGAPSAAFEPFALMRHQGKPQRRGLRIRRGISAEANRADQIRHEEPLEFGCGVRFHMGFVRTTSGVISAGNGGEKRLPQPFLLLLGMSVKRSFVVVSDDLKGRAFRGRRTAHGRCKEAGTLGSLSRVSVKPCRSWSRCRKASDRLRRFTRKPHPPKPHCLSRISLGKVALRCLRNCSALSSLSR